MPNPPRTPPTTPTDDATATSRAVGPTRRTVLGALALAPVAPALVTGCGRRSRGTVRVAVQWSGWELTAFQQVVTQFTNEVNWDVVVLPVGNDIDALFSAQEARASAPDVVMLSQPGQVQKYQADRRLVPIDKRWAEPFPPAWREPVTIDGEEYGVWFKTAHKSMVWYRPEPLDRLGIAPPQSYQDWLTANEHLVDVGLPPLSVGAADGWVLSDWFSNVLLGLDPPTYRRLGRGTDPGDWTSASVHTALTLLGRAWAPPGTFPGGVRRTLLTQFDQSVLEVFTRRRAATVAEGDFVYPVIARFARPDVSAQWFPFPAPEGGRRPVLVGGDVAVLVNKPNPQGGREFVRYLASAEAANVWVRQGGFVSVRGGVPAQEYPPMYTESTVTKRPLVDDVMVGMNGSIDFSLSDQLTGPLAGADGRGLWRILQDFLAQVGAGAGDVDGAARRTVDTIVSLLRSGR